MSSYTQLLSNYLANSSKPHSTSNPHLKPQANTYFTTTALRTDTTSQQKDTSSRYILDKYGPLSRANDSRDHFSKEKSLLGSFEIRNTENSRVSAISEGFTKPSYNADILKKPAKTLKDPYIFQGKKNEKDLFWDLSLESPSIEITKKKHEENMSNALTDLLSYKPFKNTQNGLEKVEKIEGYSNILREIDQCVTDMKKFSARTATEDHSSKISYAKPKLKKELSSEPLRNKIQNDDRLSTINFKSQETDFINNTSEFLSKQVEAVKPAYQINHFLPEKRLMKAESASERQPKKDHFSQRSSIDNKHQVQKSNKSQDDSVIDKTQSVHSSRNTSPDREVVKENVENKELDVNEEVDQGEENNIYELVKNTLKKEKLLKNCDEVIESLSKVFVGIIKNYTDEKMANKLAEIEGLKRNPLMLEKLEPFNFIPVAKAPKELQSHETQTESYETEKPSFNGQITLPQPQQQITENLPAPQIVETLNNPSEVVLGNVNENNKEQLSHRTGPTSNRPISHMYTLSFSGRKEDEKFIFQNQNAAHEFNLKEYLPKFEPVSEFDHNQEEQKEESESPSFLKTEVSRQENLPNKFSDSKRNASLPENVLKENLNEPLTSDNVSKSAFARSKGSCQSERNSARIVIDQANRSGSRWNEFSPNFFFAENDGKIQPRMGQNERSISRSPVNSSGLQNSRGFRDNEIQLGHRSATNIFSSDLKNKAEKSFLNKIQSTQQSFTNFLKQKIEEVQVGNKKETIRSITPSRLNSNTGSSLYSQTKHSREEKHIPRLPTGAKEFNKIPPKSFKKEDKMIEFPRKSSHQELGKGRWIETNFQEEGQVDKIIKSFF